MFNNYSIIFDHPEHLAETGFTPEQMFGSCVAEMEEMATQVLRILRTKANVDYLKISGPLGWFEGAIGWLTFYGMQNKKVANITIGSLMMSSRSPLRI